VTPEKSNRTRPDLPASAGGAPASLNESVPKRKSVVGAPTMEPSSTTFRWRLLAIVLGALAIRTAYVIAVARHQPLIGDAETYHLLAETVSSGRGYVRPRELFSGEVIPTAEFPPAYPLILSVASLLGFGSPSWHHMVGALIGSATVLLVGLIGRALGGDRLGLVAATLAAMYPQLIIFDGAINNEGLAAMLVAALVLAALRSNRISHFFAAGMVGGIAMLTRTELLLIVVLALVPVANRHWARRYSLAALVIGVIGVVGPWAVRNSVSLGHFTVFTNNSGTLLAGSNCDSVYRGEQVGLWRLDCVPAPTGSDESAWSAEQRSVGVNYAFDNADRVPFVLLARVARTFGIYDPIDQVRFESLEARPVRWLEIAWGAYLVMAAFALFGLLQRRRRRLSIRALVAPLLGVVLIAAIGYGNQRFRVPAEPIIVVLGAAGLLEAIDRVRGVPVASVS
jgi:4-amino-4-deoxy-L-arabinose transferase-like glycosyltransferase